MERNVLLSLRVAMNTDFADQFGNKKLGVPYFEQNSKGVIEQKLRFFTNDTDLEHFKSLYANGQIWVIAGNEAKSIFNCIDWDLVEKELEYETELLTKIKTKYENRIAS